MLRRRRYGRPEVSCSLSRLVAAANGTAQGIWANHFP